MIVDRSLLPGKPGECHDRETAIRLGVQEVLAVVRRVGLALLRQKEILVPEEQAEHFADPLDAAVEAAFSVHHPTDGADQTGLQNPHGSSSTFHSASPFTGASVSSAG